MNADATTTDTIPTPPADARPEDVRPGSSAVAGPDRAGRHRFTVAVTVGLVVVSVPYLWILWDLWSGTADPFRQVLPDNFYDLQARALMSGHLWVPNGTLGIEAFVHGGHQVTYFGLFPSLLRIPVLALTRHFDGRMTAPSLLLAWMVTGLSTSVLLWRVRVLIRGDAAVGRAEAVCSGVLVAAVTGGSVLMYLAASPKVDHEDLAWSVALTLASIFALLGVLERPSGRRVALSGGLVLLTALNRSPTGYACIIAALLMAGWFALGRGGADNRRWAVPTALVGLVALAATMLVNWAKLGMPLGLSETDQVWTTLNAHRRQYLAANGGNAFGLHFLPSTLVAYMQPAGVHLSSTFPFVSLPTGPARAVGAVILDEVYPTASIPASMPLPFLLACWGLVTAFRPRGVGRVAVTRLLLVAMAAGTAGVLFFGYIADRYLADFLPFLALAAMVGLVDLWRRLATRGGNARAVAVVAVSALGLFGVWANVGSALTPTAGWTSTQAANFVAAQRSLGGAPAVRRGGSLPYWAPAGTLFAVGDCSGLYLSTGFSYATVPGQQLQHDTWVPVEQAAGTVHVVGVEFSRPVAGTDAPVPLLRFSKAVLAVVPVGSGLVRLEVQHAGAPSVSWPAASSDPTPVSPHVQYRIAVMTDPNLQSIVAGGIGVGVGHYLAGTGPATPLPTPSTATPAAATPATATPATATPAAATATAGTGTLATVTTLRPPPAPTTLCRSLVGHPTA